MSALRKVKNVVNNYTPAEVKVREATSNDPWGPSSSIMSEIADFTYNVVAFSEIMTMIWRRINDHGKNWRHVYKSLVLLDYIIKTGSERVAQQCKENIFAIQTLKDFQFYDKDGKDQGVNVREKSKAMVALLKDDERLKTERERALKAKERFAMASQAVGSGTQDELEIGKPAAETEGSTQPDRQPAASEMEQARPQTIGEEELQLQLALAMSKEEASKSEMEQKNDDLRLQMALNESTDDVIVPSRASEQQTSTLLNLVETPLQTPTQPDPWGSNSESNVSVNDPWGAPPTVTNSDPVLAKDPWAPEIPVQPAAAIDPWTSPDARTSQQPVPKPDPWGGPAVATPLVQNDLWAPSPLTSAGPPPRQDPDSEFDFLRNDGLVTPSIVPSTHSAPPPTHSAPPPTMIPQTNGNMMQLNLTATKQKPEDFLGENSSLVNLDSLVGSPPQQSQPMEVNNPFLTSGIPAAPVSNPFHQQRAPAPTINQMRQQPFIQPMVQSASFQSNFSAVGDPSLPPPLIPSSSGVPPIGATVQQNPFL